MEFDQLASEILAEEGAVAEAETALLNACRPCFADGLAPPSAAQCEAVAQRALTLELTGTPGSLQAEQTRSALIGDWRLVFTNSDATLRGGVSGYGASPLCSTQAVLQRLGASGAEAASAALHGPGVGRVQCIEILRMPLGVRNAIALKGGWRVDEDDEGSILVSSYEAVEAGGGLELPQLAKGTAVLAAVEHAGLRARVERAPNGALFVWERQNQPIDQQVNDFLA